VRRLDRGALGGRQQRLGIGVFGDDVLARERERIRDHGDESRDDDARHDRR
jgi:hypothetical protein